MTSDLIIQLQNRNNTNFPTPINTYSNIQSSNNVYLKTFGSITTNDIMEAISKLKNGSSPGIDKISSDLLKKYSITLCKPLFFNL